MRRKIELYIEGRMADIDEQGIILYNYAFTELQTPSVVKNSFSKSVTLPGTPTNASIFGHYHRLDRAAGSGFDAGKKTPFAIYDDAGQILESGYIKLNAVVTKASIVTGYKVTFYGGLGAFFYNLSYGASGNKLTLADLDYNNMHLEEFPINATTIRAAWSRLRSHDQSQGIADQWDIINFAPAYNGIPTSKFSANKAVIDTVACGLPATVVDGTDTYNDKDGLTLLNMAQSHDEWATKDLRSYMQRPVISMKAFLEACVDFAYYLGTRLDISAVPAALYTNVWKTLPMIPGLGTFKQVTGDGEITYTRNQEDGEYIAQLSVSGVPQGASQRARISVVANFNNPQGSPMPNATMWSYTESGGLAVNHRMLTFVQCVAVDGNARIAGSEVKVLCGWTSRSGQALAEAVGFTPWAAAAFEDPMAFSLGSATYNDYKINQALAFELLSADASAYRIYFATYILTTHGTGDYEALYGYERVGFGGYNQSAYIEADSYSLESYTGSVYYETSSDARSGAIVDPLVLLQSDHTPAEYLISFCKMHGLIFDYNPGTKTVKVMPRNSWFLTDTPLDLSGRIDRSQAITIEPMVLQSKWYEMAATLQESAFAAEYETVYGQKYGSQRINTGYDLDTAVVNLMDGLAYKGAVTILDHSAYWNLIEDDGLAMPSVFVDKGNTYTLWTGTDKTKEFQVPCPPASAQITYYNDIEGYDMSNAAKLEFRDADGKALDGTDVLCRYIGSKQYEGFCVTDDTAAMLVMNNGTPCWDLTVQEGHSEYIPIFNRYNDLGASPYKVVQSLDFGIPREMDWPGVSFDQTKGSIYLRYWRAYLGDLLNANTKVMKCKVDLLGLQVGPELLRHLFWYEGSLWVLNKITNHSLTTWDTTDCEFVQVQNPANYTNGQILD